MTHIPLTVAMEAAQGGTHIIYGQRLAHRLARINIDWRALLAADMAAGRVNVRGLTLRQAAKLVGVSFGYVHTASKLSPEQRQQVETGKLTVAAVHRPKPALSDADIDAIVANYGIDHVVARLGAHKVMDALDRLTAPPPVPVSPAEDDGPADWWLEIQNKATTAANDDAPLNGERSCTRTH